MSVIKQFNRRPSVLRRRSNWLTLLCAALFLLAACSPTLSRQRSAQQAEVAERGADVMPFDLDVTQHIFMPRADGGLQQVVADDVDDGKQITLIREHLTEEAERFRRGNFDDPAQIHGQTMPGLADLRAHDGRIKVVYSDLPDGAQIEYTTKEPTLVEALHHWFEAQTSDHGAHASTGK